MRGINKQTKEKDPKVHWGKIMKFVLHTFRPSETIDGVIKLLGRHNYTADEMTHLRKEFNNLNLHVAPRVGGEFKIPVL